ncbi:potassium voltage-gated channel protein Shaw-like [Mercenaria mercenaria]|uniref:potassium voltage-gated channel protein Shaw-like n=1 Tax=Mercenaria mercenaria TaxID=6596 RepID=UPI00234E7127|nr:potassium voltage-gated channel protein Shaw-like [Mercenaria mercenaria]
MEPLSGFNRNSNIRINICGTIFECHSETLKRFKESKLAHIKRQTNHYDSVRNEYYFDRNPYMFNAILDACRKGTIHLPRDMCGASFSEELKFWDVSPSHVAPCCWEALYRNESDVVKIRKVTKYLRCDAHMIEDVQSIASWRKKLWLFFDDPSSSVNAMIWGSFISLLIVMSTITEALQTLPTFTVNLTESETRVLIEIVKLLGLENSTAANLEALKPHPYLLYTDACCHLLLTVDFLLTFMVCPRKRMYMFSYIRIIVLFGYISFWIAFMMEIHLESLTTVASIRTYMAFKYLSILQLTRLCYLVKRIPAFNIMIYTFLSSLQELKVLMFMLGILMFIFGFIMFIAEMFHNSKIDNVFVAMYWALITLTTVGYGDYYPDTAFGHVIAVTCAVCGVLVLALPIGIIASSYYTYCSYQQYAATHIRRYGANSINDDSD